MNIEKNLDVNAAATVDTDKMDGEDPALFKVSSTEAAEVTLLSADAKEERWVLWKIDMAIMPLMCIVFFFQYLDKTSLSYAAVFGMRTDTHLVGQDYSWLSTLFYLGQFFSEYPMTYLLARFQVARVVGASTVFWGIVCMCMAAVQNFAGFGAARFILGIAEGAVSPAFVLITSYWYKRSEHPMRVAAWVSCNGLAQIVGALAMYGIGKISGAAVASWRLMFLITGAFTIVFGALFLFLMPVSPLTAWFLKPKEREIAHARLQVDRLTDEHMSFDRHQLWEALLDPKVWCIFVLSILTCVTSFVITFGSIIISGFGYGSFQTMLVGLPAGGIQIFFIWVSALGMRFIPNSRNYLGCLLTLVPLIGSSLLLTLPIDNKWGLVVSCWFATVLSDLMVITLSLCASNVKGNTKKTTVNVIYFIGYCTGCCIGPQLWITAEAPRYHTGCVTNISCLAVLAATFLVYRGLCAWDNRKRDRLMETMGRVEYEAYRMEKQRGRDPSDLTDLEDISFRYVL
ncbi:major facilitator superfamily domain-containing protein [Xylogone sp. PMI_703]|nr:major facilitator superfamily domain-containing protein [Xylogone sp. PMI_703]